MNNKNFLRSHWHWHYDPPRLDNLFVVWLTAQKKREKKREREVFKERSTRFGGRAATTPGQCVPGGVLSVSLPPSPRCAWNRPAESKAGCITKPQKQAAAAEGERERGERLEVRREKMMNPRRKEKKKKKTPFFFFFFYLRASIRIPPSLFYSSLLLLSSFFRFFLLCAHRWVSYAHTQIGELDWGGEEEENKSRAETKEKKKKKKTTGELGEIRNENIQSRPVFFFFINPTSVSRRSPSASNNWEEE